MERHYRLASDFDQTLSFNDSGGALLERNGLTLHGCTDRAQICDVTTALQST